MKIEYIISRDNNGDLDIETASKLIPKLFSSLGDVYEEKN